eukprot:9242460-Pyramimonas_sp.AAC.2
MSTADVASQHPTVEPLMTRAALMVRGGTQGKHPFVYAMAELVDNALRATAKQRLPPLPGGGGDGAAGVAPRVTVSLLLGGEPSSSAVMVTDSGIGMSKRELNQWAVMNLSMEVGLHSLSPCVIGVRYGFILSPLL